MLLFLSFLSVALAQCTDAPVVNGFIPLYDNVLDTVWSGACGYRLDICYGPYPTSQSYTASFYAKGSSSDTRISSIVFYGNKEFCFSGGAFAPSPAKIHFIRVVMGNHTADSPLFYAKKLDNVSCISPTRGQSLIPGQYYNIQYQWEPGAPALAMPINVYLHRRLAVSASDVLASGTQNGPFLGKILQWQVKTIYPDADYFLRMGFAGDGTNIAQIAIDSPGFTIQCPSLPCVMATAPPQTHSPSANNGGLSSTPVSGSNSLSLF